MNWFYVDAGQQAGPVDDAQLNELVRAGKISAETLVWREGLANWQPYRDATGGGVAVVQPPGPNAPFGAASAGSGADEAVCAECRGVFKKQDMVTFGNSYVCANCKPVFMQRMAEGAQIAPVAPVEMRYAGFWIRFVAKFIDGLILGVFFFIPAFIIGFNSAMSGRPPSARLQMVQILANLGFAAAMIIYNIFFIGKFGATPGKMAVKLHVVTSRGETVSWGRATGRGFAELLSRIICAIGYIIAAFDKEKRALHDHICDTRVVYK